MGAATSDCPPRVLRHGMASGPSGSDSGIAPLPASGQPCPSLRKRCHSKLEEGASSGPHAPVQSDRLSRSGAPGAPPDSPVRAGTRPLHPAPHPAWSGRSWEASLLEGRVVGGMGVALALAQPSPSSLHCPPHRVLAKSTQGGLSSPHSEASWELPELPPWTDRGGPKPAPLWLGHFHAFLPDRQHLAGPHSPSHHLTTHPTPGWPPSSTSPAWRSRAVLFLPLRLRRPMAGTQAPGQGAVITPGQVAPFFREKICQMSRMLSPSPVPAARGQGFRECPTMEWLRGAAWVSEAVRSTD